MLLLSLVASAARGQPHTYQLDQPIGPKGTLRFKLHTAATWRDGADAEKTSAPFLKIHGVADGSVRQTKPAVGIVWRWRGGPRFQALTPELPGPETWLVQVTWDAPGGRYDVYINGMPLTTPGIRYGRWQIPESSAVVQTFDGPLTVSDFEVQPGFLSPDAVQAQVPAPLRGKHARLFGQAKMPAPLEVAKRRGRLLLDNPLASRQDAADWVLEGPGKITFQDGWMQMRSTRPDASGKVNGHIVFWCPRDFPESFLCQWDVQILSEQGLTIVFFAAKGAGGEDIFDPRLPKRDGTFAHYIRGAVNSYHISYYANTPSAPGRITSNLRKNNQFYLLATGPIAIPAGSKSVHQMRLIKDGAHVQLQVDGRVSIDYTDSGGQRYGPVYGTGKIGLRQMQWTVARYRNFRVWEWKDGVRNGR